MWEVGRRCMSSWTIATSLVQGANHSHGLLNRWRWVSICRLGAAKKPAVWLDKFNISCQESEMLKSRRASPHGFGRNNNLKKKIKKSAPLHVLVNGDIATLSSLNPKMLPNYSRRVRLRRKCIIMTHLAQCNFSVAKNKFWMSRLADPMRFFDTRCD